MKYKLVLLSIISIIIAGCAAPNIKPGDTSLSDDEGILLTRIHTNATNLHANLQTDGSMIYTEFSPIESPIDFRAIKIKAGKGSIYRISRGVLEIWRKTEDHFFIEPGKINYIGDFIIEWVDINGRLSIISGHINNENETIKIAKEIYPELFREHEYVNNTPALTIDKIYNKKELEYLSLKPLPPMIYTPTISPK